MTNTPQIDEMRLRIHQLLGVLYTPDEALVWLQTPQPLLNQRVPARMMATGEADKVLQVLRAISDGAYL